LNSNASSDGLKEDFKNCNRWLMSLGKSNQRELEISIPSDFVTQLEVPVPSFTDESATPSENPNVNASPGFQNILVSIDYSLDLSKLNFGSISFYKARPSPKNIRYLQLIGTCVNGLGRYLMPCADLTGERLAHWDLEYSVTTTDWKDVFDRIHLVSSGVLCRQVKILILVECCQLSCISLSMMKRLSRCFITKFRIFPVLQVKSLSLLVSLML
jgi:hypothetical protein